MTNDQLQIMFYEMMESISDRYSIVESAEELDEAVAVYEALEAVFVNNYRTLSIEESVVAVVRGIDVNESLMEVLAGAIECDESVGTAVASVVHAIGQKRAEWKAEKARKASMMATDKAHEVGSLAAKRTMATKAADKAHAASPTAASAFKAAFSRARSDKQYNKYLQAKQQKAVAATKAQSAQQGAEAKAQKRADLAAKIDTGINKAKERVKAGVRNAAGVVGRLAGKLM